MKSSIICFCLVLASCFIMFQAQAQVHVGIYHGGVLSQIGVGTDIDKKFFGEARFLAGDVVNFVLGVEALGHYNIKREEMYNLHIGLMVGFSDIDEGRIGVPLGLSFKPIANHKQFSLLMEGTPMIIESTLTLRANVGLRYTFKRD